MRLSRNKIEKSNVISHPGYLLTMIDPNANNDYAFYDKAHFHHMLHIEKSRAERSSKPLLLMLLDISAAIDHRMPEEATANIKAALCPSLREADIRGWYNDNQTIGVIFTEISCIDSSSIEVIIRKIHRHFCESLDPELIRNINIFFHIYPKL